MKNWKIPLYKIYTDDEDVNLITKVIKRGSSWALGQKLKNLKTQLKTMLVLIIVQL